MMPALCLFMSALMFCLALPAIAQQFVDVPPLTARVIDRAGMLSPAQREALESVLQAHEARTGSQIAILLVNKTEPEAIEQYGIRVADAWKLGRKGIDDGVILLVAKDNPPALRRLRIEAGRGVQGVLTDAQSKRILQDVIAPHFRQNDYYGGLAAGVSAIASLLDRETFPAPQGAQAQRAGAAADDGIGWLPFLFFAFIAFAMLSRARASRRRFGRNHWGGSAAGVILGAGLDALSRGGRGGWDGGGGWGGGGGFSGGGGGFDGGGASGDW